MFTINTLIPDGNTATQSVEVAVGKSQTVPTRLPFGSNTVAVHTRGFELATGKVTFVEPGTPPRDEPHPPADPMPEGEGLIASGGSVSPVRLLSVC